MRGSRNGMVFNPDYADGEMLSSVQAGLRAISADSRAALLVAGDMPGIEGGVIAQLVQAYHTRGDDFVYIPSYQMRAGHPVLVPARTGRRSWHCQPATVCARCCGLKARVCNG
jgi:CTP:molybdopterin cytidylyltransferase MocA